LINVKGDPLQISRTPAADFLRNWGFLYDK
jgi:hypothetical protein